MIDFFFFGHDLVNRFFFFLIEPSNNDILNSIKYKKNAKIKHAKKTCICFTDIETLNCIEKQR